MLKRMSLSLNKYPIIPLSLRVSPTSNTVQNEIEVDAARLFHHYYLDTRGYAPPNPDPAQFEHLSLFTTDLHLRVIGDGFGIGTAFRRSTSSQLGQAFCRWFLYEHLNITYFAHMDSVLNKPAIQGLGGYKVVRILAGDAPDYLCAKHINEIYLAEAKGRTASISFSSSEFTKWRNQFTRIEVRDTNGQSQSLKGHIVASRFATESDGSRVRSKIYAEDPQSPGSGDVREIPSLGAAVISLHYADILAKIRQPIISAALAAGSLVPAEILFTAFVWEFNTPPLQGKRFVGGYFPGVGGSLPMQLHAEGGSVTIRRSDPLRLDIGSATFFGLEENIFKALCAAVRQGPQVLAQIERLTDITSFDSSVSVLRDGTVVAPVDFVSPISLSIF